MNFTNPKARLANLDYCSAPVRGYVERILNGYSYHSITKDAIRMGLNLDCVDVINDLEVAIKALKAVRDDIQS